LFYALKILPLYQRCIAVILFWVSVPVLSEHMQLVEPKVSTASKFLHNTFFNDNFFAVRVNATVTYARSPLGTFATVIPIAKMKLVIGG
jgi:hypothetical protein